MEKLDQLNDTVDDDCEIIETHISIVDLDATRFKDDLDEGEIDSSPSNDSPPAVDAASENTATENIASLQDSTIQLSMQSEEVESSALIVLSFRDEETFNHYRAMVSDLLRQMDKNVVVQESVAQLMITVNEKPEEASFTVDTTPMKGKLSLHIPKYEVNTDEVLDDDEEQRNLRANKAKMRKKQTCFNCDGNHNLRDCKKPRNIDRINKSRKAMGPPTKMGRYHCDAEQKYGHIQPGDIRKDLRNALGLKSHELPAHIYRMRVLGYPPGWLEAHRVSHSGMNLFDSIGNLVHDGESEPGEVGALKDKFDIDKIISYPGFNTTPQENVIDEANYYNAPPMSANNSKEAMVYALRDNAVKGYKRKKLKNIVNPEDVEQHEVTDMDMDVEENGSHPISLHQQCAAMKFNPVVASPESYKIDMPSTGQTDPLLPPGTTPDDSVIVIEDTPIKTKSKNVDPANVTMAELQKEHKKLLQELSNTPACDVSKVDDSLIDDILELDKTVDTSVEMSSETPNFVAPQVIARARTMEVTKGTPLLKPVSPFETIPAGDKWCVGVSDVINFENLPDSTGKYEQMKNVIGKVRAAVQKINDEDD